MPISGDFYVGQYPFNTSVFTPILPSTLLKWKHAWDLFEKIVVFNNEVRVMRTNNPPPPNLWCSSDYYIFTSKEELDIYRLGQQLHVRAYPNIDWNEAPII